MEYKNSSDSVSLTPSTLGSSTLSSTITSSAKKTFMEMQNKAKNFFNNKYAKAVLYIILILYASVIAPKLPNWMIPYLEYPIVKIFIVFIIGVLATQDPTAAIIATIGVTVTYLFINDLQFTNQLEDINNKENEEVKQENEVKQEKKMCIQNKKSTEQFNSYAMLNRNTNTDNSDSCNNGYNPNNGKFANVEHFNTGNVYNNTVHNVEHFDVMHNNNCFINHIEEHFKP
jgi:hypothetical protein